MAFFQWKRRSIEWTLISPKLMKYAENHKNAVMGPFQTQEVQKGRPALPSFVLTKETRADTGRMKTELIFRKR